MSNETPSGANEDATAVEDASASKAKKLTPAERAEIKELYELGKSRMNELCDKYSVTRQALSKWFKEEKIQWGSRAGEVATAVNQAVTSAATTVGQEAADKYSDKRNEWIEETRVASYKALKQAEMLAKKAIATALKATPVASMASIDDDLKAIHRFQKILEQNADARLRILRADDVVDETSLPELTISDLTAEDLVKFHRENNVDDEEEIDEILKNFDQEYES